MTHNESQPDTREAIARIIDPYAYSSPDDMTPTERVLFDNQAPTRRAIALGKADDILALLGRCGVQTEYEFPYQRTFDAIAAAVSFYPTKEEPLGFNLSVRKFQEAFNSHHDKRPLASVVPSAPLAGVQTDEVQDTYLLGGPPDLRAMSGSVESDRVIQLHFNRRVTDKDREWLLAAINAKLAADASVVSSAEGK